jgi:murein DD-endopeptidase MepM/ murein hydrolase activator NlpD
MRTSLTRGVIAKALMTVATAALLAGCSNSIERFQSAYDNPSDADPVYTASVPRAKKIVKPKYKAPAYEEPAYDAASADVIEETPIKRAAIPMAKPKDYASAYKPTYKQPALTAKKPRLVPPPEEVVADAETAVEDYTPPPVVKAPFKKAQPKLMAEPEGDVAMVQPLPKKKIKFNQSTPVVEEDVADATPVVKPLRPTAKLVKPIATDAKVAEIEPVTKPKLLKKKPVLALAEEEQQAAGDSTDGEAAIGEAPKTVLVVAKPKLKEPEMAAAPVSPTGLSLRWPLKGKVISGFGNKPNGLKNEGINIAVPEGTGIRAADGGVVAYAGNELKGYGNLVLIRHPGGYVTAYAHAKELFVKRGDKVDRGAVIAKAGQTGSVTSPQLHFEVRKGATALDPMKYMGSATASN